MILSIVLVTTVMIFIISKIELQIANIDKRNSSEIKHFLRLHSLTKELA